DLDVLRDLHVVARGCGSRGIRVPPRLERCGRRVARRPQLVAAVAAKVQEPRRAQPAARAVDGEGWVGYIDVSGLLGCRHVQFRILSAHGGRPEERRSWRRYTGRREGWLTLAAVATGHSARSVPTQLLRGAWRCVAHLPQPGVAERP